MAEPQTKAGRQGFYDDRSAHNALHHTRTYRGTSGSAAVRLLTILQYRRVGREHFPHHPGVAQHRTHGEDAHTARTSLNAVVEHEQVRGGLARGIAGQVRNVRVA